MRNPLEGKKDGVNQPFVVQAINGQAVEKESDVSLSSTPKLSECPLCPKSLVSVLEPGRLS